MLTLDHRTLQCIPPGLRIDLIVLLHGPGVLHAHAPDALFSEFEAQAAVLGPFVTGSR